MGIESDQLVYDYLSRVGDLAQQHQLSSGARMRLVSTLRVEIDRQRAREGADSPAAVRRIIGRLGAPDELVGAAAESGDGEVPLPSSRTGSDAGARTGFGAGAGAAVPRPRIGFLRKGPKTSGASGAVGAPNASEGPDAPTGRGSVPATPPGRDRAQAPDEPPAAPWPHPSAPHVLGPDRQTTGDGGADWWRLEPGPFDAGTAVPGFFGGIEAPELLGRRPAGPAAEDEEADKKQAGKKDAGKEDAGKEDADRKETGGKDDGEPGAEDGGDGGAAPRRALRIAVPRPRRRKPAPVAEPAAVAAAPRRGFAHPLLLLAALLLIAGVVTGSWIPLAGGWLIAYGSRTLSRTEAKWAALGLPGVVVAGALVWVWGRLDGRWGEPVEEGALREVLTGAWPVVVRVAAVASALYLVWRARRRA
ncbi:hypothetical protein GTY66_28945 [Streptomyces sp. SID8356]|uniref:hypothetical protein n=1 Tax=unclassified Streptomyces TaxID=2593676 RepID=UPI00036C88A0|nr:hypothetical protein [Streptomyces sp. CcalMP-8W]MYT40029.1 hypothetical protein [Streptomyces sp. SID8356]